MAKKNYDEMIIAALDEQKLRNYLSKNIVHPVMIIEGTKVGDEETIKYRCTHCGHEWTLIRNNSRNRYLTNVTCPECKELMVVNSRAHENSQLTIGIEQKDSVTTHGYRDAILIDVAEINGSKGIVMGLYEVDVKYEFTECLKSFEISLNLKYRAFFANDQKIMFTSDGRKTTKLLSNAFYTWKSCKCITEAVNAISKDLLWLAEYPSVEGINWTHSFDRYWEQRRTRGKKSLGEAHAEATLIKYKVPPMPAFEINETAIMMKEVSQDLITGKHQMEYYCMGCGNRFSNTVSYSNSNITCPKCGLETGYGKANLRSNSLQTDYGVLTILENNVLFLRGGILWCHFDDDFNKSYEHQEKYRVFIELNPGKNPVVHFLVNEGVFDNPIWKEKKNYASAKFYFHIKQLEYVGDLDAIKFTGLKEYIQFKFERRPYSSSVLIQDIIHYVRFQSMFPIVEQLCKRGFVHTLDDEMQNRHDREEIVYVMKLEEKKIVDVLGLPERLIKHYLKGEDIHSRLVRFKKLYELDCNVREEDIDWLQEYGVDEVQVADLLRESEMSIMRLCEYLENVRINQCFEPKNAISDWRDYLRAAKTIEVDLTDNKARYPSSLKREHDRATAKQKLILDAKKDEVFRVETERYGKLYSYKTEQYMIIPPKNMKDLFEEGRKLNHCVGSYSDRILAGQSCIMFIRKAEEPEKPYFTIEINQSRGYVVQLRANSNRLINPTAEKELVKFLREWSKKKNVALNGAA